MTRKPATSQQIGLTLLFGYLLSPLALQIAVSGWPVLRNTAFLAAALTSLLWVSLAFFSVRRPLVFHIAILPLYLTTTADLFLLHVFGTRLSSGYISIALSDQTNTADFLSTYLQYIVFHVVIFVCIYGVGIYCIRAYRRHRSPLWAGSSAIALLGVYGFGIGHFSSGGAEFRLATMDLAGHEMSAPVGAIFQAALALKIHGDNQGTIKQRAGSTIGATKDPSSKNEIYVWVVGESSRPMNWSLYGYDRDTTPRLRRTANVIPLPAMLTTAPHTSVAVPSMLSLQPITNWPAVLGNKSIVSAFNEVGFETHWLSAQDADGWSGIIPQMALEAQSLRYFKDGYDGSLLDELRAIIAGKSQGGSRKLFIVLHSKGSHFDYQRRYPSGFAHFSTPGASRQRRIVDTYDNTILYTDWFLSEIISVLAEQNADSLLIYASDHGENLLDDASQLLGHAQGTRFDLATASFIWLSDNYRRSHPEMISALEKNSKLPLSLSNLPHTMLDLAGVCAPALDPSLSVANPAFALHERHYIVRGDLRTEAAVPLLQSDR